MSLQIFGEVLVGLRVVVAGSVCVLCFQASPLLGPVVFVIALVVIAALCDADLEEVGIMKHRGGGGVASARVSVDSHAIEVDEGIRPGKIPHPSDLIGN